MNYQATALNANNLLSHTNIATNSLQIAQAMKSHLDYNTAAFIGFLPFYHIVSKN
jgi:acyl-CoA synthetase (AMP-forming)/AMP-acid ligase II